MLDHQVSRGSGWSRAVDLEKDPGTRPLLGRWWQPREWCAVTFVSRRAFSKYEGHYEMTSWSMDDDPPVDDWKVKPVRSGRYMRNLLMRGVMGILDGAERKEGNMLGLARA